MPRVAQPPGRQGSTYQGQTSQIPLNDDRHEKAIRIQSRQARHGLQMDQIKAAASPVRRLASYDRAASSSPKTPTKAQRRVPSGNKDDEGLLAVVSGSSMTPMKRVPMLANFEEWMKMATDNKINATNSWNFALIDYFHDMSLLKEGDGVNFQKASCTLDGCVKIYTSRVDSVATETGKLLSGLADSGNRKDKRSEGDEDGEGSEDEDGEDGVKKRAKKKAQRSSEATLAPSFAPLQLKKFELEFSVDPLFKKASADFDEGGAKGLLLNHLAIDGGGRIVFDSSDDADGEADKSADAEDGAMEDTPDKATPEPEKQAVHIDIDALSARFFPNLDILAGQDICPSLKGFDLSNPNASLDIPSLKDMEAAAAGADGGDDFGNGAVDLDFDLGPETGFGDGGEAWAQNAALAPLHETQEQDLDEDVEIPGGIQLSDPTFHIAMVHQNPNAQNHENILSYFDQSLRSNWAGPQHWKIRRVNEAAKANATPAPTKRKEKEAFEIDFLAPLGAEAAAALYTTASTNSVITLPKAQWKSKARNLLPDDKHFNSRQLVRLFLKPKAHIGHSATSRSVASRHAPLQNDVNPLDEAYWAKAQSQPREIPLESSSPDRPRGQYDADFFQDDGLAFPGGLPDEDVDDDFADAREHLSPDADDATAMPALPGPDATGLLGPDSTQAFGMMTQNVTAFGTALVTQTSRLRPEYVQYARVAKKVDVRKLKEEMWKGIGYENLADAKPEPERSHPLPTPAPEAEDDTMDTMKLTEESSALRFTDVMNGLKRSYAKPALADISTSYCFICLLHLANEKGLSLTSERGLEELSIRRDATASAAELEAGA